MHWAQFGEAKYSFPSHHCIGCTFSLHVDYNYFNIKRDSASRRLLWKAGCIDTSYYATSHRNQNSGPQCCNQVPIINLDICAKAS